MKRKFGWINNGTETTPHFDFVESKEWSEQRLEEERRRVFQNIKKLESEELLNNSEGWLILAARLPYDLRMVLVSELQNRNQLVSLSANDWPNPGSIVARLKFTFRKENRDVAPSLPWRKLADPHYCQEEICQKANGTEYLLIC